MKKLPLLLATTALLAGALPAQAHIVLQEAEIGKTFRAVLVVDHGCGKAVERTPF